MLSTDSAADFVHKYLKHQGLQVREVPFMSLKLYIEAVSPADIHRHVPPSHQQAIRDIVHLPDDQYAVYISGAASIPLNLWVRVK